ncbi:helix-turn-helix domain protein [Halothece sp. PCC 7418]|uniref:helix-turn-helix domain-containing protein n=1 Tax=Halothece sp. (strain PCC 7418) TaxID=65093 RepID=UPI0002A05AD2|nr:helix-turn-helix domain-containing protein [Halothece sp. PCC 7418]AFZ42583.1 helix-turn-helix domain protein [Halothece sp. PCC 7418]
MTFNQQSQWDSETNPESSNDYTLILKSLMETVKITNFKQLSERAGVSPKQIRNLRRGKVKSMRVEVLLALRSVLGVSVDELIALFSGETATSSREQFQRESLQIIESWLLQWPTAVSAIAQNPDLPAQRIIKLLNPLEKLLQSWGVERIGQVGEEVPYNPQQHQLLSGNVKPDSTVRVRYVGYRHGEKLLYRAQVEPID